MCQPPRMFGNGFEILLQCFSNLLYRHTRSFRNQKQYLNAAMICRALEMPLHLFCGFHIPILSQSQQHSDILENVGMLLLMNNPLMLFKNRKPLWRGAFYRTILGIPTNREDTSLKTKVADALKKVNWRLSTTQPISSRRRTL